MTTKHIPGPWRVDGLGIKWVSHGKWRILAKAGGTGLTIEANMANARLIAAAPDLLAALKAIVVNAGYESGEALPQLRELNVSRSCLDAARAALARAEGKS